MGGKTVDVRILEAVGFVLAGAACGSSSGPPARNVEVVQVAPSPSAATSPIATASAPPVAIAPPEKVDGTTPQALCEDYRRRVKVDPASVTKTTEGHGLLPAGEVQARPNGNGKITCVIRRVHEPATVTYTFQPRCCPPPHGPRPACPPQQRKAEGWRTLIENVVLAEDGTFLSTSAVWSTRPKDDENERQPYCGRRPEGFAAAPAATRDTGALLAEMSMLEAAAVAAFDRLARELEALGAPEAFVLRARRAREDEVRHARVTRSSRVATAPTPRLRSRPRCRAATRSRSRSRTQPKAASSRRTARSSRRSRPSVRAIPRSVEPSCASRGTSAAMPSSRPTSTGGSARSSPRRAQRSKRRAPPPSGSSSRTRRGRPLSPRATTRSGHRPVTKPSRSRGLFSGSPRPDAPDATRRGAIPRGFPRCACGPALV